VRSLPLRSGVVLMLVVCVIAVQAFRQWRGWKTIPGLIVFGTAMYIGGAAAFHTYGWIVPVGDLLLVGILAPLFIYGVEFAAVERSISAQMRLLQGWLTYRDDSSPDEPSDLSWRIKVLKDLQQELGLRFELYRSLIEATRDLVAVFDADGSLLFGNAAFNNAWRPVSPLSFNEVRSHLIASEHAPLSESSSTLEGEATFHGALYSIRTVPLPSTSLTPNGGTLLSMTSLHLREELDRARSEALGFVTHELRTPLVAIQGFAEMMTRYPESTATQHAPATILRESRRLLALINSYLDVLRTDAGARPLRMEAINVDRMIRQVFDLLTPIAQASNIRLDLRCDDSLTVQGDEALLTGAVLNLISNAIKYGCSNSEVSVVAEIAGSDLRITVHNLGQPIASDEIESLFGTFFRGTRDEEKPGWGLGLSFVKRIAVKHGGRVSVTSSLEDGTTFTLHVPGAKASIGASSR
jgi:signal transduction histidine kinase